ncbi:hypothetical protein [Rhodomicrobium lacus]|uniref:hypothetical protein n=1 Tax=Rhodomicrobium lacus TaxID=2498452 RepID=UPI0026E36CE3|nr:hypothetical protein [Rhodomicrobium lacus]WKW52026.1 hypothetical protein QMO75_05975 [Rhodomicrobium lacus]
MPTLREISNAYAAARGVDERNRIYKRALKLRDQGLIFHSGATSQGSPIDYSELETATALLLLSGPDAQMGLNLLANIALKLPERLARALPAIKAERSVWLRATEFNESPDHPRSGQVDLALGLADELFARPLDVDDRLARIVFYPVSGVLQPAFQWLAEKR